MNKIKNLFGDSWTEVMENVTWTTFSELTSSSSLVLVASLIFAMVVGLIDFVFKSGLELFYQSF
jgi:preprotein translocase subunit SecE